MDLAVGMGLTLLSLFGPGILFLRRSLPILLFYNAMCILALGYLIATGAIEDIGLRAHMLGTQLFKYLEDFHLQTFRSPIN